MEGQKEYLAAFAAFPKTNTAFWQKTVGYFPDLKTAWQARASDFKSAGVNERTLVEFLDFRQKCDPENEQRKLERYGISLITLADENYPKNLKEIFNPPFVLFVRGKLKPEDNLALAVVGSRRATDYGRRVTTEITAAVAQAGVTIVSGLALGLDAEAHKAAISAGGRTIAVLANGLDQIRPFSNEMIGRKILENGAIISEQPIGMPSLRQNFPARNRIISGLSLGVLITEAGEKSGTIHTANFALEQNRQIFTVPGPIYNPLSAGPNALLKMGAKPVTNSQDILEDFGIEQKAVEKTFPENENEEIVFEILGTEPKHIDAITREWGKEVREVSQALSMMEIKGKVKHLGGMVYTLR